MDTLFPILVTLAVLSVVAVLFTGLFSMARGGEFNRKYGNILMRWRVGLQGLAVLLFVVAWLIKHWS